MEKKCAGGLWPHGGGLLRGERAAHAQRGNDLPAAAYPVCRLSTAPAQLCGNDVHGGRGDPALINDREQVTLHAGELLMMNQRATHAIERAEEGDLAVNIMVQPAFFQEMLAAVGEDNPLGRFLVGSLTDRPEALSSLVFHVAQDVPVQCVLESMVATLTAGGAPLRVNQAAMTLLFLHLLSRPETLAGNLPGQADHALVWEALREIQDHYAAPSLTALAARHRVTLSYISRLVKRATGRSWTELLQEKRLMRADELLLRTRLPVSEIMNLVGYNNSSYFYRLYTSALAVHPKCAARRAARKTATHKRKVRTEISCKLRPVFSWETLLR